MPRPRTPLAKAKLTGAASVHPERFGARSEPTSEVIGPPPDWLDPGAKKAWRSFCQEWPWLTKSDEAALVALCLMRHQIETTPIVNLTPKFFSEYRLQLSAFGGNPTSKTKVQTPKPDQPDDPFAKFGNGPRQ